MGTKVECKSYLPGYYSMRDLNEESSSSSWPLFYGDNGITNGQYHNGFVPRNLIDGYQGYDKDTLKQKMLEHEAVFKNQVYELHRLYRIQRDMMEDVKTRESVDLSSSSSLQGSQIPSEDPRKWHMAGFPLLSSAHTGPSNSPVSYTKGINTQTGRSPFQNGCKEYEALDSRPLKVRKMLFDLQLPANEYVDTEDVEKGSGIRDGVTDCRVDASTSHFRNNIRLADLNEPIQIEETMASSSVHLFGQTFVTGEGKGIIQSANSITRDKLLINSSVESRVDDRGRLFHLYEAGSSKSNHRSQGHRQEKLPAPSHQGQGMLYPLHHPSGMYPTKEDPWRNGIHHGPSKEGPWRNGIHHGPTKEDPWRNGIHHGPIKEDPWRNGIHHGLEYSNRNIDHSNNTHLGPEVSQGPTSFPFINSSSSFAGSPAQSLSSWKPNSFAQNTFNTSSFNSAAAVDRCLPFGGKWMVNSNSRLIPGSSSAITVTPNRYHDGSDHLTNRGFGKFPVSSFVDIKPALDINLNEVLSSNAEDHSLPSWLKPKPVHVNETANRLNCKSERVRDLNQEPTPNERSDCDIIVRNKIGETQNVKTILGVPIFDMNNEPSTSNRVFNGKRSRMIDINLECEPDEEIAAEEFVVEKEKKSNQIDLNTRLSDSEDTSESLYESKRPRLKIPLDIDLEAPYLLESEDDNAPLEEDSPNEASLHLVENEKDHIQDDMLRNAAEAMLFVSSSFPGIVIEDESEAPTMETFLSFVDDINSYANVTQSNGLPNPDMPKEMDEFETMTLCLAETKEEDYMPVPFVPDPKIEDSGANAAPTRPRRGQARRGRQKRDFQRDILPGLVSLSRHEVTEDIQIFGGMMKATGHSWTSGLTRRNGARRGRKRIVVETVVNAGPVPACAPIVPQPQINNIEACLEDRSLTGWGKTTRRPRRQRCPNGNPPTAVVLT